MSHKETVANTIAQQIGNPAFVMMGAKNLVDHGNALSFKVGRNAKSATHVMVTLDASDTYTVEILRCNVRAKEMRKVLEQVEGVYADQLRIAIEKGTGLALSL